MEEKIELMTEDDYVNAKTLQLLSQKKPGVEVILFTEKYHCGASSKDAGRKVCANREQFNKKIVAYK